jgi:polysaccharide pyruvyl transferase WcaK-like protein
LPEILLTFAGVAAQKGSAAQVVSLVSQIRQMRPDVRLTVLSHYSDLDAPWAAQLGIDVAGYPLELRVTQTSRSLRLMGLQIGTIATALGRRVWLPASTASSDVVSSAYRRADLVLDLSGDSYRDPPGGRSIAHNVNLLACQAMRVPYAIVSQSLGPFRWRNRPLTRYCLNRARVVYVREKNTVRALTGMGVRSSLLHLAPDLAFALPPASESAIDRIAASAFPGWATLPRPFIGISISELIFNRLPRPDRRPALEAMLRLTLHINRTLGASIFLIPHYIVPPQLGSDDRSAADLLARELGDPRWLHVFRRDSSASEIKGLISRFDAFVACRMHAGIAALSSGVPTLMVGWSPKYAGVMDEIGLRRFVSDVRDRDTAGLVRRFDSLWYERENLRDCLTQFNRSTGLAIRQAVERLMLGM